MSLELIRLGWLARELQGVPCPHLPRAGIRSTCCHPWLLFYVGSGVSNSAPHVCKAIALEAHHLPSPFSVFLSNLTAQLSCEVPPAPTPFWRRIQLVPLNLSFSFLSFAFPWAFWAHCLDGGFTVAFLTVHSTPTPAVLDSHSPSLTSALHLHSSGFIPSVSEETDSSPEVLSESCFQTAGITFEPVGGIWVWVWPFLGFV